MQYLKKVDDTSSDSQEESDSDVRRDCRAKQRQKKRKKDSKGKRQIETIELSDSSEEASSEESADEMFQNGASGKQKYGPSKREAVPPEVFDVNSRLTLRNFLDVYERYFSFKFNGTQRDCCRKLGAFLQGEVKEAYDAVGGNQSQMKYKDMKEHLLQWYRSQNVWRISRNRAEFEKVRMKEGETFKLYCMRLQEIAKRAYPSDAYKATKKMKKKLIATVPEWFAACIEKKEEMKKMLNKGKKVSWSDIVEVAEMQDKKKLKKKCMMAESTRYLLGSRGQECNIFQGAPLTPGHSNGGHSNVRAQSSNQMRRCYYCGRPRHVEAQCRLKNGSCFGCGVKGHIVANCPIASQSSNFRPKCSSCGGPHLGKDCGKTINRGREGKIQSLNSGSSHQGENCNNVEESQASNSFNWAGRPKIEREPGQYSQMGIQDQEVLPWNSGIYKRNPSSVGSELKRISNTWSWN